MRIVADSHIPFVDRSFKESVDLILLPAIEITPSVLQKADGLIVRTRTICDQNLLEGSSVGHIATATIGFDHIDTLYCEAQNIGWSNATGCNARSVAQYVFAALSKIALERNKPLRGQTIGIIGVGHVGSQVAAIATAIGMTVLCNDPYRAIDNPTAFVSLDEIAAESDFITVHTPLTLNGLYPTYHLLDQCFFNQLKKHPAIINSARGGVVDESALLSAMDNGAVSEAVIDCWENEPKINLELLSKSIIGTPHIAGYSLDGKRNATRMAVTALAKALQIESELLDLDFELSPPLEPVIRIETSALAIEKILLSTYSIDQDSRFLQQNPDLFEYYRNHYPLRREYQAYSLLGKVPKEVEELGFERMING